LKKDRYRKNCPSSQTKTPIRGGRSWWACGNAELAKSRKSREGSSSQGLARTGRRVEGRFGGQSNAEGRPMETLGEIQASREKRNELGRLEEKRLGEKRGLDREAGRNAAEA